MSKYKSYILAQFELMRDDPEVCSARGMSAASNHPMAQFGIGVRIHNSELVPLPEPIRRDQEFCERLKVGFGFLYMIPGLLGLAYAVPDMVCNEAVGLRQVSLAAIAWINLWYVLRCASRGHGLFYIVEKWQCAIESERAIFKKECRQLFDDLAFESNK
jgi:hypothetical protein